MLLNEKYTTKVIYKAFFSQQKDVPWKCAVYRNAARRKAIHTLWMSCHKKFPTKERLHKFGMISNNDCCLCRKVETVDHLLFDCPATRIIWETILKWIEIDHILKSWSEKLDWLIAILQKEELKSYNHLMCFDKNSV
ncbi:unnamed protein product [Vicia faba]|uniref:Reverse transcriptase zinc-binding domain-containing protein n=1 Tax=Vicia faba TaxID=3906 RepID=A0AAV0ZGC8_VICFA|nr:unnamed protein product [Vicia faba]